MPDENIHLGIRVSGRRPVPKCVSVANKSLFIAIIDNGDAWEEQDGRNRIPASKKIQVVSKNYGCQPPHHFTASIAEPCALSHAGDMLSAAG